MRSLLRRLAAALVVVAMLAGPLAASAAPARAPSSVSDTSDRPAETRRGVVAAQEGASLGTPEAASDPSIAARAEETAATDEPPPPTEGPPTADDGAVAVETPPAPDVVPSDPAVEAPPAEPVTEPVAAPATEPAPAPPEQPPVDSPAGDPTAEPDAPVPEDTAAPEPTEVTTGEGEAEIPSQALAANQPPVARDDAYAVEQGGTLTVDAASGLLANDTDAEGDALSAFVSSDPLPNGTLAANGDGSFAYTPNAGFVGTETFTYKASDGTFDFSNTASVTIAVTAPGANTPPVAVDDFATTPLDTAVDVPILANDTDADGDALDACGLGGAGNSGRSELREVNGITILTFTPDPNFLGDELAGYCLTDGTDQVDGLVHITVTAVVANTPPVATDNAFTTRENRPLAIGIGADLLSDDIDNSGTGIALESTTQPAHGSVSRDGDDLIYTPTAGFSGTDAFTYRIGDGTTLSNFATVTIDVVPLAKNTPPVAVDDAYEVTEGVTLTVTAANGVLANDSDADGDALTATLVTDTSHGSVGFLGSDGVFSYSPDLGFFGDDTFTYQVSDGIDTSAVATVTITVVPASGPPVPQDDAYTVAQDTVLTVDAASGVLANDADPDGDPLHVLYELDSGTFHGDLSGLSVPDGSFTYAPDPGFVGADTFQYRAFDGTVQTELVTVTITVTAAGANTPPVARDDAYAVAKDTTLVVDAASGLLVNDEDVDGDPLLAELQSVPANGTVAFNGPGGFTGDGGFTYTPNAGFVGADSFAYFVSDGTALSFSATVTVVVTDPATNLPPVAVDDAYATPQDTTLTVDAASGLLANDTDDNGAAVLAELQTTPSHGTVTLNGPGGFAGDGSFVYTPEPGFAGTDSFQYFVSDGLALSFSATVTITVTAAGANTPPVANDSAYTIPNDGVLTVDAANGVLAGDTDADGDLLTVDDVTDPAHGTLSVDTDGAFIYTPSPGFAGDDSFTYTVIDQRGGSDAGEASIFVTDAANALPFAGDDIFKAVKDTVLIVDAPGILGNDTDANGDPLTPSAPATERNGTVSIAADGSFAFTPDPGFIGDASFQYIVSDGVPGGSSNVATVTIKVTEEPNVPPVANDDAFIVAKNGVFTSGFPGLLVNDTDADGDALAVITAAKEVNGTFNNVSQDGSFSFTPDPGFVGDAAFSYLISDGFDTSNEATVTISVFDPAANTPPVANDDAFPAVQDVPLTINAPGFLANDVDADGDALTAKISTGPLPNGTLAANADGSFVYTPNLGFVGTESFTYVASDGFIAGTSNVATVTITVGDPTVNTPPVAADDAYSIPQDTELAVDAVSGLLANDSDADGDALSTGVITPPAHGTLVLNGDGSFTYAPDAGFSGSDGFIYQVGDGSADGTVGNVTITVTAAGGANNSPVAGDDVYNTPRDTLLTVDALAGLLANDDDQDGDQIEVTGVSPVAHGIVDFAADGSFSFTPEAGFVGATSFLYTVADGNGGEDTSAVTVDVTPVNTPPVAADDAYSTAQDTDLTVAAATGVLANDTDADGDALVAAGFGIPANGTLVSAGDGSFSYSPNAGFAGTDSFTYKASDGNGFEFDEATVTITVTAAGTNTPPVANDDAYTVAQDGTLTVDVATGVLANDSDADGDTLFAFGGGPASHGSLIFRADGSFAYTPDTGFSGTDTFIYQITDGGSFADTGEVTIIVTAAPPAGSPSPAPSPDPSPAPSPDPSPEPSPDPSPEPTEEPRPTDPPTDEPTGEPTEGPTGDPTEEPGGEPTPTQQPPEGEGPAEEPAATPEQPGNSPGGGQRPSPTLPADPTNVDKNSVPTQRDDAVSPARDQAAGSTASELPHTGAGTNAAQDRAPWLSLVLLAAGLFGAWLAIRRRASTGWR